MTAWILLVVVAVCLVMVAIMWGETWRNLRKWRQLDRELEQARHDWAEWVKQKDEGHDDKPK